MRRLADCCRTGRASAWKRPERFALGFIHSSHSAFHVCNAGRVDWMRWRVTQSFSGWWHYEKPLCPSSQIVGPDLIWLFFFFLNVWLVAGAPAFSAVYSLANWQLLMDSGWWAYSGTRKTGLSRTPWVTTGSLGTAGPARSTLTRGTLQGGENKTNKQTVNGYYRDDRVLILIPAGQTGEVLLTSRRREDSILMESFGA